MTLDPVSIPAPPSPSSCASSCTPDCGCAAGNENEALDAAAPTFHAGRRDLLWCGGVVLAIAFWGLLYSQLKGLSERAIAMLTSAIPSLEAGSHLASAFEFFIYDTPKVLMLMVLVVFIMGVVRSFFSPEKTRVLLAERTGVLGNAMAAGLGVLTPFCSCSAIPLFVGFLSAGVPMGMTFSFLIAAPMVNEVALILLFGLVGWKVATLYLVFGLGIAVVAGWALGRFGLENWLEGWVQDIRSTPTSAFSERITAVERIYSGLESIREIVGKVWIWIVLGVGIGAYVHGFVPEALLAGIMGRDAWWSVPAAVVLGVPMYTNAAGIIPIAEALLEKGAGLGAVLAFMMSVIALSLPEMIILRKVLTLKLIAVFVGIVASGILAVGLVFNIIF